jgi:hypothetical protein
VETEPVFYRTEAMAVLGALADILVELRAISFLLGGFDEEEEEDDEG